MIGEQTGRTLEIARLSTTQPDFQQALTELRDWQDESARVTDVVTAILADVRRRGDTAVLEHTARLDSHPVPSAGALEVPAARLHEAYQGIAEAERAALETAAERIRDYHERQKQVSWQYQDADGSVLGQYVTPLRRVGVYVPGGQAAYPSSLLMNVIPARVAGVEQVIMVAPAPDGAISDLVLAAAHVARVDRVFLIGGAQAIGALTYGTETVPAVDKVVGPGNAYVAEAKRQVFGRVGIDMLAGPSEIVVVCDGYTPAEWIAMDLFSQAEHDAAASAVLICPDPLFLDQVQAAMERLLPELERAEVIRAALNARGALIAVRDLSEAASVTNELAPEHLELSVAEPERLAASIRHAGAIFLGRYTPEVLGDYCAGPNHVLPTSQTARFASPLGVYDFQKRTSVLGCSQAGAARLARTAAVLARGEGLTAHAQAAELRQDGEPDRDATSKWIGNRP